MRMLLGNAGTVEEPLRWPAVKSPVFRSESPASQAALLVK